MLLFNPEVLPLELIIILFSLTTSHLISISYGLSIKSLGVKNVPIEPDPVQIFCLV